MTEMDNDEIPLGQDAEEASVGDCEIVEGEQGKMADGKEKEQPVKVEAVTSSDNQVGDGDRKEDKDDFPVKTDPSAPVESENQDKEPASAGNQNDICDSQAKDVEVSPRKTEENTKVVVDASEDATTSAPEEASASAKEDGQVSAKEEAPVSAKEEVQVSVKEEAEASTSEVEQTSSSVVEQASVSEEILPASVSEVPASVPEDVPATSQVEVPSTALGDLESSSSQEEVPASAPDEIPASAPEDAPATSHDEGLSTAPDDLAPSSSQDEIPASAPEDAPATSHDEVLSTAPDDLAPSSSQDEIPASAPEDAPATSHDEVLSTAPDDLAPSSSQEEVPASAPDEIPASAPEDAPATSYDEVLSTAPDDLAPSSSQEEVLASAPEEVVENTPDVASEVIPANNADDSVPVTTEEGVTATIDESSMVSVPAIEDAAPAALGEASSVSEVKTSEEVLEKPAAVKRAPPKVLPKPKIEPPEIKVDLFVKAHARFPNKLGDCPFCHRIMMILKLKKIGGTVCPVNLNIKSKEFEDFCARNGLPTKVPIIQHGETVIADSNAIADYLDKIRPEPKLVCLSKATNAAGDKVFLKFSAFIKNRIKANDEKLQQGLVDELSRLESFLASSSGAFLDGDDLKHPDCVLLPKLHHVRVAAKYYKKFEIPEHFKHVHTYLAAADKHPVFASTVPADDAVVEGWRKHAS